MDIKTMWQTVWNTVRVPLGISLFALGAIACPAFVLVGIISCQKLAIGLCIVIAMVMGHIILYLFSRSFHVYGKESDDNGGCASSETESVEIEKLRQFIEEKYDGKGKRIVTDYRFPNGNRVDIVVLTEDGQYPIMCFEFASNKDKVGMCSKQLFNLMRKYKNQLDLFVAQKKDDGTYQLFKIQGSGDFYVVNTLTRFDYNTAEKRTDKLVQTARKRKLFYPILFISFSVTPIVESMMLLSCFGVVNANLVIWAPVSVWIVSFLAIMGVGIKGYMPNFDELS